MICPVNKLYSHRLLFLLLGTMALFLVSCETYNFSQPQPVDRENIYVFPDELTGKWMESPFTDNSDFFVPPGNKESHMEGSGNSYGGGASKNKFSSVNQYLGDEGSSFYNITKNYVSIIISEKEKVVTGAWPKFVNGKGFIYPHGNAGGYAVLKSINYDSLKKPVDTVNNYILSRNKIYEKHNDGFLEKGYNYYLDKDTIIVIKKDTFTIDLGQNAFLRKLNDSLYAFNIKKTAIGGEEDENWWMLVLVEKAAKDSLVQWECSSKTGGLDCMFYNRLSKSDYFYFDCNLSAAEILRLKKEGYFTHTATYKRIPK